MLNFIRSLAGKSWVRKLAKYAIIATSIWLVGYMFNLNYQFVNSRGIHGIVARKTFNALIDDHAKAHAYDTIPAQYLINADQ